MHKVRYKGGARFPLLIKGSDYVVEDEDLIGGRLYFLIEDNWYNSYFFN